ncbi:MAG: hypothetical protein OEY64_03635 [Nitrospinota bacterium]|nr:hypothetical protein [Nitrospinota bacterium]
MWDAAISWVDERRSMIASVSKRYQVYTAYDIEDYLSQAYLIAYETLMEIGGPGKKFEQFFWVRFKGHAFKVSMNPIPPEEIKPSQDIDKDVIKKMLDIMTQKEREVWECYLGGSTTKGQVAGELGKKSQHRVKMLKRRGFQRVARSAERRELLESIRCS